MKYYVYEPSGGLTTDVGFDWKEVTAYGEWLSGAPVPTEPIRMQVYNPEARLPDIFSPSSSQPRFFSERATAVFKEVCGEDENLYIPGFAYPQQEKHKGKHPPIPYTAIWPLKELDCLDESKSIFIATQIGANPHYPYKPFQWTYENIEVMAFKDDVVKGHHHFRLAGYNEHHFISQELARELKKIKRSNITIEPIDKFFRIQEYHLKKNPLDPRNLTQSLLYRNREGWADFVKKFNVRRRNINDP